MSLHICDDKMYSSDEFKGLKLAGFDILVQFSQLFYLFVLAYQ